MAAIIRPNPYRPEHHPVDASDFSEAESGVVDFPEQEKNF